ncbi:hypothetical protein Hanom_Chr11g00992731 [Helianthus anomalus]
MCRVGFGYGYKIPDYKNNRFWVWFFCAPLVAVKGIVVQVMVMKMVIAELRRKILFF